MARSILVVDDESGIRQSLTSILEEEGYRVEAVGSGEECLATVAARPFDLILLDVWLPGMDGLVTLERLQQSVQAFGVACSTQTLKKLAGARRRTSPGVEQGHIHLPAGECLIQHRQVGDNQREKPEARSGLDHGDHARKRRVWPDIAKTEREERRATQVKAVTQPSVPAR